MCFVCATFKRTFALTVRFSRIRSRIEWSRATATGLPRTTVGAAIHGLLLDCALASVRSVHFGILDFFGACAKRLSFRTTGAWMPGDETQARAPQSINKPHSTD
jgi:hypothetical protein